MTSNWIRCLSFALCSAGCAAPVPPDASSAPEATATAPSEISTAPLAATTAPAPSAEPPRSAPPDPDFGNSGGRNVVVVERAGPKTDPAPAPATSPAPASSPSFALTVKAGGPGGTESLVYGGETLHTGDDFWFELRVFEPLHLYVVWLSANGERNVLYPTDRDAALEPGEARRVPNDAGSFFELDKTPGVERLVLVGSREALSSSDPKLARAVAAVHGGSRSTKRRASAGASRPVAPSGGAQAPGPAQPNADPVRYEESFDDAGRGVVVVKKGGNHSIDVVPGADGVFVTTFTLNHVP